MKITCALILSCICGVVTAGSCKLDTYGNYICDYGGNLGGSGYSYGEINGKKFESYGYGNGGSTEIEFDGGLKIDCWKYGKRYECN